MCAARLRQDFETTLPRFDLMAQLERYPKGLRMSELSKRLMVSGGNVTGITDQLEREGLVVRTLDPADRRAVSVKLTEKGLQRFREMAAQSRDAGSSELLGGLSPEEKQSMFGLLRKLKIHLGISRRLPRRRRSRAADCEDDAMSLLPGVAAPIAGPPHSCWRSYRGATLSV